MKTKLFTIAGILLTIFLLSGFKMPLISTVLTKNTSTTVHKYDNGTPYLVKEFNVTTPVQIKVRTSGGFINVESRYSNKVRVEMYVHKNGRNLTKKDTDLKNYDIEISKSGNEIQAIARRKSGIHFGFWNNMSINFVVYGPKNANCDIRTSGGHLELTGLNGQLNAHTSGGGIRATDVSGEVKLNTSGGAITVNHQNGNLSANTSGGPIRVSDADGTLTLRTSGGGIRLDEVSGQIDARTSGGGIRASVKNVKNYLTLRTSGGNISASIPSGQGYDLDLSGSSVHTHLSDFDGSMKSDNVRGTVKGGGPKIVLKTSGGSIHLNQK